MASLARAGVGPVRRLANEVAAESSDPIEVWDSFVRSVYVYRDEDREIVRTIPFMLEWFQVYGVLEGDCDCISTFSAAAVTALGFPSRFVAIRTDEFSPEFLHVYAEAFDGEWRRLDPTVPVSVVDGEVDYGRLIENV